MSETICDRLLDLVVELGLPRERVASVHANPQDLVVTVYDEDDGGGPFLEVLTDDGWVPIKGAEYDRDSARVRVATTEHRFPTLAPIADVTLADRVSA